MSAKKMDLDAPERPKLEIKIPGLIGGAAASVVSALIGSRLGLQGTLIGAAASSIILGLTSPFLTFSIERSHHGLRAVSRRAGQGVEPGEAAENSDAQGAAPTPAGGATLAPEPVRVCRRLPVGLAMAGMVLTALATFGVTLGVLSVTEASTGRSVDGGYTSTVGGLTSGSAAAAERSEDQSTDSRSASGSDNTEESATVASRTTGTLATAAGSAEDESTASPEAGAVQPQTSASASPEPSASTIQQPTPEATPTIRASESTPEATPVAAQRTVTPESVASASPSPQG